METLESDYTYVALPDATCIRVLELYPSLDMFSPVYGNLHLTRLHSLDESANRSNSSSSTYVADIPYTALSYSWGMNEDGDASLNRHINLGDRKLLITQNLFEGLRRIRPRLSSIWLWIDAICIDQQNMAERSAQVARMHQIFSGARQTFIWLGESISPLDDQAVLAMMACAEQSRIEDSFHATNPQHEWQTTDGRLVNWCRVRTQDDIAQRYLDDPLFGSEVNDILHRSTALAGRRYFSRLWVLQEIYNSRYKERDPVIWLGPFRSLIDVLRNGFQSFANLFFISEDAESDERAMQHASKTLAATRMTNSLLPLVADYSYLRCSDPRDLLYAFVGLDPSCGIKPDYSLPLSEVYMQFAIKVVESGHFSSLLYSLRQRYVLPAPDLPSWILDISAYHFQLKPFREGASSATERVDRSRNIVHCQLHELGTAVQVGTNKEPELRFRHSQGTGQPTTMISEFGEDIKLSLVRDGDIFCAHGVYSTFLLVVILRSDPDNASLHRLVAVAAVLEKDWNQRTTSFWDELYEHYQDYDIDQSPAQEYCIA